MQYVNFNGNLIPVQEAPANVQGSVFRFDSGLFESMLVTHHVLQLKDYHFQRLQKGLQQSGYNTPAFFTEDFFVQETLRTIQANNTAEHYRVRFQVQSKKGNFSFLIEVIPIEDVVFLLNSKGWKLGIIDISLKPFDGVGNLKAINIPLYTTGAEIAAEHGWNDVLLSHDNRIVESGGANIFWIKDQVIFTPPLSHGCIEGTMRKYLMTQLYNRYKLLEKKLTMEELFTADEVFLTNAVRRIKWVAQIKDRTYSNIITPAIYSDLFG